MTNYYIEFGRDPGESTEALLEFFTKELRKWVQRAGAAAKLEDRQEAEIKAKHVREAKVIFANEDSRKRYDFELYNQPTENAVVVSDEVVDEAYEIDLARLKEFLTDSDYVNAFKKAEKMLLSDNKTVDVYEVLLLSLHNQKEYGQVIERFTEAVDRRIEDSSLYRVFAFACEERKEFSRARKELLKLIERKPNDFMSYYTVAELFLHNFDGEYFSEARDYIDFLLENANLNNADEVIEWDIRYEFTHDHIPALVAKMANYLADSDLSKATLNKVCDDFTEKLDKYVRNSGNMEMLQEYMKKFNQWTSKERENNEALCNAFPLWDCILSMEVSGDNIKQNTWEKLVEKYKTIEITQETANYLAAQAKRFVQSCPVYNQTLLATIDEIQRHEQRVDELEAAYNKAEKALENAKRSYNRGQMTVESYNTYVEANNSSLESWRDARKSAPTPALHIENHRDYYPVRHILETINSLFQTKNQKKNPADFEEFISEIDSQHAVIPKLPINRIKYLLWSVVSALAFAFLFVKSAVMIFNQYFTPDAKAEEFFNGLGIKSEFSNINSWGVSLIYSLAFAIFAIGLYIALVSLLKRILQRHKWYMNEALHGFLKAINTLLYIPLVLLAISAVGYFILRSFPAIQKLFENTIYINLPKLFQEIPQPLGMLEGVIGLQPIVSAVISFIFLIVTWGMLSSISEKMKATIPNSKFANWCLYS